MHRNDLLGVFVFYLTSSMQYGNIEYRLKAVRKEEL